MTPKEKAQELLDKFNKDDLLFWEINMIHTVRIWLIAIDEIINNNSKIPGNVNGLHTIENTSYWQEVKQELENFKNK
jgi:hypothetical protein